jgi:small subunit ribosomal protein S4
MNYTGPKVKLSRKFGVALTPKARKYMENKPYPPGQHGPDMRKNAKMSDFKKQLFEKQKLRYQYNISEKQMSKYYDEAKRREGSTPENLLQILECRLDALVLRGGLAGSIYASRQLINHGHIFVNGKKLDKPSYMVKPGDVLSVKEKSRKMQLINNAVKLAHPPSYLALDKPKMEVTFLHRPSRADIPVICDEILVIEYYSR